MDCIATVYTVGGDNIVPCTTQHSLIDSEKSAQDESLELRLRVMRIVRVRVKSYGHC